MLKKHLGGLTLFVFAFTFILPLLVGIDTSDAGPTQVFKQDWLTEFFCPDGTYATYSEGKHVKEYYHGHPEDKCEWVVITGGDDNPSNDIWRWVCLHRDGHATTYYYNSTLDYTRVTLWNNANYCGD